MNKDYWKQKYKELSVEFQNYKLEKDKEILDAKLAATRINYQYSMILREIRTKYEVGELPLSSEIIKQLNKGIKKDAKSNF